MKYSDKNKPLVCMMTNSTCYRGTTAGKPVGILWHCTGCNNPTVKRYVQPSNNDTNYKELIAKIGKNNNGNDWNHVTVQAGVNAWLGKLADGTVAAVQTLPWNYRPWGCGSGKYGSCNGKTGGPCWIQFEICEDALTDKTYFNKCYTEACELTAYLCKMFDIDPNGTVVYNGVSVPTILCHYDSYNKGLGSNHYDVYNWFNKMSKKMDNVRSDVKALLAPAPEPVPEKYYRVRKTWADSKSQLGAYKDLELAKNNCPEDYFVFDNDGKVVFEGDNNMTQDRFNELMTAWMTEQAKKEPSGWSQEARDWAEKNKIVNGDENGNKQYKKLMTKEEIITMLKAASTIKAIKVRPTKSIFTKEK